jgi:ABC-type transporter Mla maintaining outer membrane lipid asymmetry ATPase subunit MlaF
MAENSQFNGPIVEASDVSVFSRWSRKVEVDAVNWSVQPGEFWVIGGAHGSGKTEFLMTVAGLHRPVNGKLKLFGRDLAELSESQILSQRQRIGFVFKGGGRMFTELTVAENVALALCYHRNCTMDKAWEDVRATLEATGLADIAGLPADSLGADWQQRVGLARAMALQPELIFLDEPAAGLEARHRQWCQSFLTELRAPSASEARKQITVVATTNDFTLWRGEKRRYALLKGQRLHVFAEDTVNPQIE